MNRHECIVAAAFALVVAGVAAMPSLQAQAPAPPSIGPAPALFIRLARLWDGTRTVDDAYVLMRGGKVVQVGSGRAAPPAGATVLDLSTLSGVPGLIDLHTHMTSYWDPSSGTKPLSQPRRTPAETATLAGANALRTLESGVTTVRDLGAAGGADYLMRDAINAGRMAGPRMFVAGQGLSAGRGGPSPDLFRTNAEQRVKAGSDWVKVYGSRGSFQNVETTQTVTFDEMKAAVDAAHALGHKAAIHSYGPSGVHDAVMAGADSVEHGIEIDDATLREMKARGTVWVPTIDHNQYYVDSRTEFGWSPDVVPPLNDYIEKNLESATRAVKIGVKLGMGSDAVYSMFGRNTGELRWLVKAGLSPAGALETATTTAADLLGQKEHLGRVAPGFAADLVAVDGNPTTTIDAIYNIRLVIKDGVIVVDKRK